ncbi:MAG TPA: PTS sugar transporter subunit IIA [Thiothrix sp.]|nr:PTS sugar transporter subunit IIA [Thiothrix sp.]
MDFIRLLEPERIYCQAAIQSKKRAFEKLAQLLAHPLIDYDNKQKSASASVIFSALLQREKLGCTALGQGIAIPHTRAHIPAPRAAILTLNEGIDLNAPDKKPVHTLIALILPKTVSPRDSDTLHKLILNFAQQAAIKNLQQFTHAEQMIDYLSTNFCPVLAAA